MRPEDNTAQDFPIEGMGSSGSKKCHVCFRILPMDRFFKHNIMKEGYRNECKDCMNDQSKHHRRTLRGKWTTAKKKSQIRGLVFTITFERYKELMSFGCYYCGIVLLGSYGTSLDRINNEIGYVNENVLPCCPMCNRIRHVYLTVDEMKAVADLLKSMRNKHYIRTVDEA